MTFFGRTLLQGQGDVYREYPRLNEEVSNGPITSKRVDTTRFYPKCVLCDQFIQNIVVQALDKTWHPEHFRCSHCQVPISTQKFYVHEGNPYCVEDYAALFLRKCQGCKLPIKDVVLTALNQTWHQDHFVCISCGCKLVHRDFYEKEDNAFCTDCYESKFCSKCVECGAPITDTAVKIHDKRWHEGCFKCDHCACSINVASGAPFRLSGSEVLCHDCARKIDKERAEKELRRVVQVDRMRRESERFIGREEVKADIFGGTQNRTRELLHLGQEIDREKGIFHLREDSKKMSHSKQEKREVGIFDRIAEYIGRAEEEIKKENPSPAADVSKSGGESWENSQWREMGRNVRSTERGGYVRYFEGSDDEAIVS